MLNNKFIISSSNSYCYNIDFIFGRRLNSCTPARHFAPTLRWAVMTAQSPNNSTSVRISMPIPMERKHNKAVEKELFTAEEMTSFDMKRKKEEKSNQVWANPISYYGLLVSKILYGDIDKTKVIVRQYMKALISPRWELPPTLRHTQERKNSWCLFITMRRKIVENQTTLLVPPSENWIVKYR